MNNSITTLLRLHLLGMKLIAIKYEKNGFRKSFLKRLSQVQDVCTKADVYSTLRYCPLKSSKTLEFYFDLSTTTTKRRYIGYYQFDMNLSKQDFAIHFDEMLKDMQKKLIQFIKDYPL